eukprot:gene35248-44777_t
MRRVGDPAAARLLPSKERARALRVLSVCGPVVWRLDAFLRQLTRRSRVLYRATPAPCAASGGVVDGTLVPWPHFASLCADPRGAGAGAGGCGA